MGVDYNQLRTLTARELRAALERDGFSLARQKGSHQQYVHRDGRRVTVAAHGSGDTFHSATLRRIIEQQAGWTEDDLVRVRLQKK